MFDIYLLCLDELCCYVEEYVSVQMVVISLVQLMNCCVFLDCLDSVVVQQCQIVDINCEKVEVECVCLVLVSCDKQVLEQLVVSYWVQEKVLIDCCDQCEMDDIGVCCSCQVQCGDGDNGGML